MLHTVLKRGSDLRFLCIWNGISSPTKNSIQTLIFKIKGISSWSPFKFPVRIHCSILGLSKHSSFFLTLFFKLIISLIHSLGNLVIFLNYFNCNIIIVFSEMYKELGGGHFSKLLWTAQNRKIFKMKKIYIQDFILLNDLGEWRGWLSLGKLSEFWSEEPLKAPFPLKTSSLCVHIGPLGSKRWSRKQSRKVAIKSSQAYWREKNDFC